MLSILLAATLIYPVATVQTQASDQLAGYSVMLEVIGGGEIWIRYDVDEIVRMTKRGVHVICAEYKNSAERWNNVSKLS